jgi:hypothetical protein
VFRAMHAPQSDAVAHELSGPRAMVELAKAALVAPDWSARMAEVAVACTTGRTEIAQASASGSLLSVQETLYSWVIAPVERV